MSKKKIILYFIPTIIAIFILTILEVKVHLDNAKYQEELKEANETIAELKLELAEYRTDDRLIANCPVCGGHDLVIDDIGMSYDVECKNCGMRSGFYHTVEELIEVWNNSGKEAN